MHHTELLKRFYDSFSAGDAQSMAACYHEDIIFHDPAFGTLKGKSAKYMWEMLLNKKDNDLEIDYKILNANDKQGKVQWTARYGYGPKKRKVVNTVTASFEFKEDKIIKHTDYFNLWAWSRQALGISGYLLGWSSFLKNKIQQKTGKLLNSYIKTKSKTVPEDMV